MSKEYKHPLWPQFEKFCIENSISLIERDDWFSWWECYLAGAMALHFKQTGEENGNSSN